MSARSIGTPYKHFRPADERYDVIVVGSGMGGLGTAAFLSKIDGLRVLVLERHFTAGGFTHVFRRPGFEWDVGVHYVGELHRQSRLTTLFEYVSEGRVAWQAMPDAYDRIVVGDEPFDYVTGEDRLRDALLARFPSERAAIDRYFAIIRSLVRRAPWFYSEKALPGPLAAIAGPAMRYPFMALARRTTADVLTSIGASPMLAAFLTGHGAITAPRRRSAASACTDSRRSTTSPGRPIRSEAPAKLREACCPRSNATAAPSWSMRR